MATFHVLVMRKLTDELRAAFDSRGYAVAATWGPVRHGYGESLDPTQRFAFSVRVPAEDRDEAADRVAAALGDDEAEIRHAILVQDDAKA